jgi:hypothetical protein
MNGNEPPPDASDAAIVRRYRRALIPTIAVALPLTAAAWLAVYWLSPPLDGMEEPSARLAYALGWTCVAVLLAFVTGIEAVAHRRLFSRAIDPLAGAESPATKVDLRYLQHTLEQLALFAPGLFGLAYYGDDPRAIHAVTATAVMWIVGRWAFWIGYHRGSEWRGVGAPGMLQSMLVLLYAVFRFGHDLAGLIGGLAPIAVFLAIEARLFQLARRGGVIR